MLRYTRRRRSSAARQGGDGRWIAALASCSLFLLILVGVGWSQPGVPATSSLPLTFRIVPAESRVWFDADAPLHSFRGVTQQVTGAFTLQHTSPLRIADARVIIAAASFETGNSARDADMRQDFLEVARFPTIEFTVTDLLVIRPVVDGMSWDVVMQGQLTVHGTTRKVRIPASVDLTTARLTVRGQVRLDMRDYQIRVPRLLLVPMSSEVLVGFDIVAYPAS
jgi:polyisoprenoid-binding protein YceI